MSHDAINNVRRKLNEVLKKTDEKIVVGWRPGLTPARQENEVWTDMDGREWTVKNGIKQNVTKLDGAKTPWFCPHCEKAMNHRFDIKFWRIRGKCMECVVKDESQIRRNGEWETYEKKKLQENYIASLKNEIGQLQEYYNTVSSPEFIYADDTKILMIEKWNVDIDKIKEELQKDITELQTHLETLQAREDYVVVE